MGRTTTFILHCLCCLVTVTAIQAADKQVPVTGLIYQAPISDFSDQAVRKDPGVPIQSGAEIETGDCSDYIDLSGQSLPISVAGTTIGATNNYGAFPSYPICWFVINSWDFNSCAGRDRTYKWTVPADGRYTISLCGSSYDTGLLLYNFTCPAEPSYPQDFICGSDDFCGLQSAVPLMELTAGQEILIVVDGYGNSAGAYQLHISEYQPAADLDSFIDSTMVAEHIPGLTACAIYDGDIIWSENYGFANIADQIAPTDTTLFYMASISKTVVGVALMQLWEDGLFSLDDDINQYLPWAVHNPNYPDSPITFRMLITHTSGIIDNWGVLGPLYTYGGDSPIPLDSFLEDYLVPGGSYYHMTNFGDYVPGTVRSFSSVGITLAGYLVERINPDSASLEEYCQENIFSPLDMNNTSWFLANLNIENIAVPYRWNGSGYTPYQHCGLPYYPAAQLRTSRSQLDRYLIAFMQHGQIEGSRILDSTTVELMTTIQTPGYMPDMGLCWIPYEWGGRSIWGHTGRWNGCRTIMFYCPEENSGAIVVTNGESSAVVWYVLNELFEYVAHYASVPEPNGKPSIPEDFALFQNYPNPFNPSTTIAYDLSKAGHVSLRVFDLLGREVAVLKDGFSEAGTHRVVFDGSELASGIYFARLEAVSFSQTKKLMLLK